MGALPLVVAHDGLDVVGHDLHQGRVAVDVGDPAGELAVPDEGVASHLLAVLGGEVGDLVGAAEGELALVGLGGIPLHGILRGDGAELVLVLDDVLLLVVVADRQGRADVLPATGNHGGIETCHLAGGEAAVYELARRAGRDTSG